MNPERPDLSTLPEEIVAYIESLEAELARFTVPKVKLSQMEEDISDEPIDEPSEPPTTINMVTISRSGMAKRTPRHLYSRQRRGGMGIFDLDTSEDDPPIVITLADEAQTLILFSNVGRCYRMPASKLPESPVRARGLRLAELIPLRDGEHIVAALPEKGGTHVILLSERGWVQPVRASFVGPSMIPGVTYYDAAKRGSLVAVCWSDGNGEILIATRQGQGIRFPERLISDSGTLGIRLDREDAAVAVASVTDESGVFLLSTDGKGSIRTMEGFRANKMPGAGGKVVLKTDTLIGAVRVDTADDIFIISRNSKIIRFQAKEVPPKTGVVQGVNCMSLRGDETMAVVVAKMSE
ncbi:MAG: hypothetical protein JXA33_09775 [Anaerolineae bacterium]|nr:hypothetical protein [Anaerolineae bacterium]